MLKATGSTGLGWRTQLPAEPHSWVAWHAALSAGVQEKTTARMKRSEVLVAVGLLLRALTADAAAQQFSVDFPKAPVSRPICCCEAPGFDQSSDAELITSRSSATTLTSSY